MGYNFDFKEFLEENEKYIFITILFLCLLIFVYELLCIKPRDKTEEIVYGRQVSTSNMSARSIFGSCVVELDTNEAVVAPCKKGIYRNTRVKIIKRTYKNNEVEYVIVGPIEVGDRLR